jgi:hypothetical protein
VKRKFTVTGIESSESGLGPVKITASRSSDEEIVYHVHEDLAPKIRQKIVVTIEDGTDG